MKLYLKPILHLLCSVLILLLLIEQVSANVQANQQQQKQQVIGASKSRQGNSSNSTGSGSVKASPGQSENNYAIQRNKRVGRQEQMLPKQNQHHQLRHQGNQTKVIRSQPIKNGANTKSQYQRQQQQHHRHNQQAAPKLEAQRPLANKGGKMYTFDRHSGGKQVALLPGLLDETLLNRGSFSFGAKQVAFNKLKVLGNVYVNRVNGRKLRDTYLFKSTK